MSHRAREQPKKPISLMQVATLSGRHPVSSALNCHQRRISNDHHPLQHHLKALKAHNKYASAVKLVAKMAIILLANQSGALNATLVPSSQMQYKSILSTSNHDRLALAAATHEPISKQSSRSLSPNDISSYFEWPRVTKSSTSEKQASHSPTESSERTAAGSGAQDLARLHQVGDENYDKRSRQRWRTSENDSDLSARVQNETNSSNTTRMRHLNKLSEALNHTKVAPIRAISTEPVKRSDADDKAPEPSERPLQLRSGTDKKARSINDDTFFDLDEPAQALREPHNVSSQNFDARLDQLVEVAESKQIEHDPECALILKRTYILNQNAETDEWGEKFVFNDVDPEDGREQNKKKRKVHKTDLCIRHSDVDKALQEAKHRIKFEKPNDLDSFEVAERSLASIGELNLATGLLLTKRFDLSHDEIMNALPMIDMSASKVYWNDLCPKPVRPMGCTRSRYRTITGHCNNLQHPSWGASKTPYSRYLPPDYADGLSAPRAAHNGGPLPSARLITSNVHQDSDEPSHDYSVLFADWGQLLNHDITRVAVGEAPDCCPQLLKGLCMPIPVPPDDPLYSQHNVKCLKFDRSLAAIRPKCLLGHRAQINLITSSVDASFVYGSTKQQAARLRTFTEGKMKVLNWFEKHKLKPLLPPKLENPDKDCLARPKHLFCFEAGDVRVNEQTHLTVLHTIYLREHNRIAKQLAKLNMEWDDEKIYHETRHIVAAGVQHVMANEFLPLLLGNHHVNEYKLKPTKEGYWDGYDPSVTISTGTAFASAAFRYGHSMIEGVIRRLEPKTGQHVKSELLRHLFKRPFWLYEPGAIDQLIAGMLLTPAEQTDPWVSAELSGHLFQPPKAKFGHDLAAINIQRGRDQGVPGYNDWREWCGLKRARSFDDLEPLLMHQTAMQYSRLYKHVDDIDLWSAGISERKLPGSAVGPTMACIIARQFLNYKRGDRFWYENAGQPSSFTPDQLREIKKISLAKILCMNADEFARIQPWAMRLPHPIYNAKVPCESLPTINLKFWDSSLADSFD